MDALKNFFKIFFLIIAIGGICFELLIIIALDSLENEFTEETLPEDTESYNISAATLNVLEQTKETKEIFSYIDAEDFEHMLIIQADFQIDNIGDNLKHYYNLSSFVITDEEDNSYDSEYINYYPDQEGAYAYNSLSVIPTGQSGTVTYYLLIEEEQYINLSEIHVYPSYNSEEYVYFIFE